MPKPIDGEGEMGKREKEGEWEGGKEREQMWSSPHQQVLVVL